MVQKKTATRRKSSSVRLGTAKKTTASRRTIRSARKSPRGLNF